MPPHTDEDLLKLADEIDGAIGVTVRRRDAADGKVRTTSLMADHRAMLVAALRHSASVSQEVMDWATDEFKKIAEYKATNPGWESECKPARKVITSASVVGEREAIARAVKRILKEGEFPEYRTDDDRGLEPDEYTDFVLKVLDALTSRGKADAGRKWDQGEHEGCGIDSECAFLVQQLREKALWREDIHHGLHIAAADMIQRLRGAAQAVQQPPAGLAEAIAAKLKHPIFQGLRWETYDAYLPLKFVGPCSVTDWYAKTPSGKEIIVSAADKNDCISLHDAIVPEASSVPSADREAGK